MKRNCLFIIFVLMCKHTFASERKTTLIEEIVERKQIINEAPFYKVQDAV